MTEKEAWLKAAATTAMIAVNDFNAYMDICRQAAELRAFGDKLQRCTDELAKLDKFTSLRVVTSNDSSWCPDLELEPLKQAVRQLLTEKQLSLKKSMRTHFAALVTNAAKAALEVMPEGPPREEVSENG